MILAWASPFNTFKPEFRIVIHINCNPRIAGSILDF